MKKHTNRTYHQQVFLRKKYFVKVIWRKVDNLASLQPQSRWSLWETLILSGIYVRFSSFAKKNKNENEYKIYSFT